MNYHWNWSIFFQMSPNYDLSYLRLFLDGVFTTLSLSVASWGIAMLLGSVVGILRTTRNPFARGFGLCYVQIFRGIPLLVQMFLWYFIFPSLSPALKDWANATPPHILQFVLATVCLGLYTSARLAEQVRSGVNSISRGQQAAALALGLRGFQAYLYVLLPQAYRIILPPLTSETMNLIKNTSIALTIGLAEITFRAREMGETTFAYFEAFTVATIAYVLIALIANSGSKLLERHLDSIQGDVSGKKECAEPKGTSAVRTTYPG